MSPKQQQAVEAFRNGLNCSQSVFSVYCGQLNIDKKLALSVACGFGAGMGRLQLTCGAVTGSFMVISVYTGQKFTENSERKSQSYALIQSFSKRFESIHNSTQCRRILNCDLNSEEGRKYCADNDLFRVVCEKCITDSIAIIDELIEI
jgi:C_GCAxxG_C_C family probable redox protein